MSSNIVPPQLYHYFENAGIKRKYQPNEIIYMQGDHNPNIYLICKGRVRMYCMGNSGKEITLQIIGEGQIIGDSAIFGQAARETTLLAVNEVEVIICGIEDLFPYMQQDKELNEVIIKLLTSDYGKLCRQLKRMTLYNSKQRVASYLLEQTEERCEELGIVDNTLPYTHEELGQKKIQVLHRNLLQEILDKPDEKDSDTFR